MTATVANPDCALIRGFNYQPSYGSTGYELWRKFDASVIEKELRRGKAYFPKMSHIRFWLSWDAFVRDPRGCESNFESALCIADDLGLKVMPVLFNRWHDPELDYGGIYIDHFLPSAGYMQKAEMFEPYLEAIVGGHADDNRIFCWDLCNEPFLYTKGRGALSEFPGIPKTEMEWLEGLYRSCKRLRAAAPLTVGTHQHTPLESIDRISDILSVHPYYNGRMNYPNGSSFEETIDSWVAFANKTNKPLLATECCWGSQVDEERVDFIRHTLSLLRDRNVGFLVYLLHHSLIADAHRIEFGPVGSPGNLSFIEADGSLRAGHDVWNEFSGPPSQLKAFPGWPR